MDSNTLNGFEVFSGFSHNVGEKEISKDINIKETEYIDNKLDLDGFGEELSDEELDALRGKGKEETVEEEEEEQEEPKKPTKAKKESTKETKSKEKIEEQSTEDTEDDNDNEEHTTEDPADTEVITSFFNALSEKMGWELDDEDEVPSTAEELIEYFQEVIEESSVPQYANDEVAKLDEFVRNGGDIRDYFSIDADLDLENINIEEDELSQKAVIKEFLKEKGFSSKQIDKKISKYEDAGLLSDEAEDALEALREIKEEKKEQLLAEQKKVAEESKKQQQVFFDNVVNEIKGLDSIRGIAIPKKDKQQLLEYIFRPESDGKTRYQKDYAKSVKNLIESAYFTMKGDTLLASAQKEGKKKAIDSFKNSLKNNSGVSKRSQKQTRRNEDDGTMWSSFTRQLRVA